MKKITSIVTITVLAVVLCVGAAISLAIKLVNPNNFKDQISSIVLTKTGRQLTINGSIGWSFFPWLGVKTYDVSMNNPASFRNAKFASIGELDVQVRTLPLFLGKVDVKRLVLKDAELKLIEKENGENNWVDFLTVLTKPSGATETTASTQSSFDISNINLVNASVYIDNQKNKNNFVLTNLFLQGKNLNTEGKEFHLDLRAEVQNSNPGFAIAFALGGDATVDLAQKRYVVRNLQGNGNLLKMPSLLRALPFTIRANIVTDLQKQTLDVDSYQIGLANSVADGAFHATNIHFAPKVIGDIQSVAFDPKQLLFAFGLLPANFDVKQASLLKMASFKATLQTTSKFLKMPTLEFKLDDAVLQGQASYSHFTDKYLVFDVDLNKLDYDGYMRLFAPVVGPGTGKTVKSKSKAEALIAAVSGGVATKESSVDMATALRQMRIDGDLRVKEVYFNKLRFSNVLAQVSGDFGKLNVDPIDFNFYGGKGRASLAVDMTKDITKIAINANAAAIVLQPLFASLTNTSKISGIADLTVKLLTRGNSGNEALKNLSGTGTIAVTRGMFYSVDVNYLIDKANMLLSKKSSNLQATQPPRTTFESLSAAFNIKDGILRTNNLVVKAAEFYIRGKGSVDLLKLSLNFLLEASDRNNNLHVPIRVSNTLAEPNIVPDLSGFVKNIITDNLTKNLQDQLQGQVQKQDGSKPIKIKLDKINDLLHL